MKRVFACFLSVVIILSCCACTSKKAIAEETTVATSTQKMDVDLTLLSSTMVYSEVNNMVTMPDEYIGKTVKMNGTFSTDENNMYYFCIISDATACCSQGLEFILKGEPPFESYPTLGSQITVTGTFESYYEGTDIYYHLVDCTLDA